MMGECATASQHQPPPPEYYEWLKKLKDLAAAESNNSWEIGDLLNEGQDHFDLNNLIGRLPGYMSIERKPDADGHYHALKLPNFWKDVSTETGLSVPRLKNLARVAYAFKNKEDRFPEFTFTHHDCVATYEKRKEYLAETKREWERRLEENPNAKKPSVAWTTQFAERTEGKSEIEADDKVITIKIAPETWNKLRDLGKFYGVRMGDLVGPRCEAVIEQYVEEMAKKLTLERFGFYEEGSPIEWPFDKKPITRGEKKRAARRDTRKSNNPERRAIAKKAAVNFRVIRRNELMSA